MRFNVLYKYGIDIVDGAGRFCYSVLDSVINALFGRSDQLNYFYDRHN